MISQKKKPAIFFDRDGVLNVDRGFVHKPEDFEWTAGALEAIKWCNDNGYLVIVVTNQSGIARGYYSEDCFHRLTDWVNEGLHEIGAHIDATYFCPHHPEVQGEYGIECTCRKPADGLIRRAIDEWNIDPDASLLIGDKEIDLEAAESAGIRGLLFQGENLLEFVQQKVKE